jgi:hypothetical protein
MKIKNYYYIILALSLLLSSCTKPNKNEISACGVSNPQKNLPWLVELITTAKADNTGNYLGVIWLEKYNEQDVFVTNMMLGSGGLAYHVFDCQGSFLTIESTEAEEFFNNLKFNIVIYASPHPLDK